MDFGQMLQGCSTLATSFVFVARVGDLEAQLPTSGSCLLSALRQCTLYTIKRIASGNEKCQAITCQMFPYCPCRNFMSSPISPVVNRSPYRQRLPLTTQLQAISHNELTCPWELCSLQRTAASCPAPCRTRTRASSPFSGTWLPDSSKQTAYDRTLSPPRSKTDNLLQTTGGSKKNLSPSRKGHHVQRM